MGVTYYRLVQGEEAALRLRPLGAQLDSDDLDPAPLEPRWREPAFELEGDGPLPDLFEWGGRYMVSARFEDLLKRHRVVAEFLPIRLKALRSFHGRYTMLHPTERLDCIDYEASIFERYGQGDNFTVKRFQRLAFRDDIIGDRDLFRPLRYPAIYVSHNVKDAATRAELQLRFAEVPSAF